MVELEGGSARFEHVFLQQKEQKKRPTRTHVLHQGRLTGCCWETVL